MPCVDSSFGPLTNGPRTGSCTRCASRLDPETLTMRWRAEDSPGSVESGRIFSAPGRQVVDSGASSTTSKANVVREDHVGSSPIALVSPV